MNIKTMLKMKGLFLNPKRSDCFVTWIFLDGWRLCEVTVGSKKATLKPLAGGRKKTLTIRQIKEELKSTYWYAARQDASAKARAEGRKKRKANWESDYA